MPVPENLRSFLLRPGVFTTCTTFKEVVAFVNGFDIARDGGTLVGFREWLIVRLGGGENLLWEGLVLRLDDPESQRNLREICESNPRQGAEILLQVLEEFTHDRDQPEGLLRIMREYSAWLEAQPWYEKPT